MSWISTNSFTGYMDLCYGISSHDQSVFYFPCDPVSAVWFDDWMSLTVILLLCGIPQEQRHEYNHQSTWAFVQDVFLSEVEFYAVHFPSLYRVKSQVTLDAIWNICPFPLISKACNSFDYRHREKEKERKKKHLAGKTSQRLERPTFQILDPCHFEMETSLVSYNNFKI